MPTPALIGTFKDPEKPEEFFCIAMEDLSVEYDAMPGKDGITKAEAILMAKQAARMHAHFWGSKTLEQPWLNKKDDKGKFGLGRAGDGVAGCLCRWYSQRWGPR